MPDSAFSTFVCKVCDPGRLLPLWGQTLLLFSVAPGPDVWCSCSAGPEVPHAVRSSQEAACPKTITGLGWFPCVWSHCRCYLVTQAGLQQLHLQLRWGWPEPKCSRLSFFSFFFTAKLHCDHSVDQTWHLCSREDLFPVERCLLEGSLPKPPADKHIFDLNINLDWLRLTDHAHQG